VTLRVNRSTSHNRTEVEHVVFDVPSVLLADEHVQAVDAAGIVVVQPRTEHARGPELAAVLMRHGVVGIVGPCALRGRSSGIQAARLWRVTR
jgi:hypothetical protein